MKKHFIQADQLLRDSYNLAWKIFESGFKPDYIIGVWRGGAPVGIAVQEFLDFLEYSFPKKLGLDSKITSWDLTHRIPR